VLCQHTETDALTHQHCWPSAWFVEPTDDLARKTADAVANDLTEDGFVLRYRTDENR
jgi:GH15 family glucan-1,4-alpha-glucosidase